MPHKVKQPIINQDVFELVINATEVGVWDWQIPTGELIFNERWASLIGYTVEELQPIQFETWANTIHPEDLIKANEQLERYWQGKAEIYQVEARMKHKGGHYIWVLASGKCISWDDDGNPKRMIGTHLDITQRKLDEQDLVTKTKLLDESQKIAKLGGWELDLISTELFWTKETFRIHETSEQDFDPTVDAGLNLYLPESKKVLEVALHKAISEGENYDLTLQMYTTKGRKIDVRTTCIVTQTNGITTKLTGIFQDISEQMKTLRSLENSNQSLKNHAHYDPLTNLPNRNLLSERMRSAMLRSKRSEKSVAIAFIDLDGFKKINDQYGHKIGDEFLCHISNNLKNCIRECDTLARFGGDEFVAILDEINHEQSFTPMLNRMLEAVATPVIIDGKSLKVSGSIGVTLYPEDPSNSDQLIRHADQAMYIAKQSGKNTFYLFDVEKDVAIKHRYEEIKLIKSAFHNNEFILFYQPKVDLKNMKVLGFEALIRWQHPVFGILAPGQFLPVIEHNMLTVELGEKVISDALRQLNQWHHTNPELTISVNITPLQLQQADFVEKLEAILNKHPNYRPGRLILEIVENVSLNDVNHVAKVINQCSELGVLFAIDDFGTGYSSLSYLKRLKAKYIKIDRSFIQGMLSNPEDSAIVEATIELARVFKRKIIAEGVETLEHGKRLKQMRCDYAQGFGIAMPMPVEELANWLSEWEYNTDWQSFNEEAIVLAEYSDYN